MKAWRRRLLIGLLATAGLLVAVGLFAGLALPGIVRSQAEHQAQERLHRRLVIDAVHINPLTLDFALDGVRLMEADGATVFAGFERLAVGLSWSSLAHLAPVVREVHLVRPTARLVRSGPGQYNVDTLLAALQERPPAPEPAPAAAAPPRFAVHNIHVEGGRFEFEDQPLHEQHALSEVSLGIPFLSSFAAEQAIFVEPHLHALVDGAALDLKGRAQPLVPVPDYAFALELQDIDLSRYVDYLPASLPLRPTAGHLGLQLELAATLPAGQAPQLQLKGRLGLKGLELAGPGGKPHLRFAALDLDVAQAALPRYTLDAALTVNGTGHLSVKGELPPAGPMAAQVSVATLDLLPAWPLVAGQLNLKLTRALLSGKGTVHATRGADGALQGDFHGDLSLDRVAAIDAVNANDFLNWNSLALQGIAVQASPPSLHVDAIVLKDFFARIIVSPQGRLNLQDLARSGAGERRSLTDATPGAQPAAAPAPGPARAAPAAALPPVSIGRVALQGGHVRFTDNFIKPRYSADLMGLAGTVAGLSSDPASTATVDLQGTVNDAPLRIGGSVNPLRASPSLDVRGSVHDMELAPLSAYSDKYVGYHIERGKLSFDVAYQLADRRLQASNHLVLDQLTFGDRVDSPSATSLPVMLAVALLKDRDGVIDIDLPIGGSLDDPDFSVGGVILKVLVNLVEKAVTAPFALLGHLFGGDSEELSWAAFEPGSATVPPASEGRLKALAKALAARPGLGLDIAGVADPAGDIQALARQRLESKLRAGKRQELAARGALVTGAEVVVAPEERAALLARVYAASRAAGAAPGQAAPPPPQPSLAQMEQFLMDQDPVGEGDLVALGNRRAQAVKTWLLTVGAVAEQRLSLVHAKLATASGDTPGARVDFALH